MSPDTIQSLKALYAKYPDDGLPPRIINLLKLRRRLRLDIIDECRKGTKYKVMAGLIADVSQEMTIVLEEIERRLPASGGPAPF